jgi:hypothetical protein
MKQLILFAAIPATFISCGGKSSRNNNGLNTVTNVRQVNLAVSDLQKLQQSKSFSEVHTFMISKGWDLYKSNVQTTEERPYGSSARLPFECKKSEWTFEKIPDVGTAKGWFRFLNYKDIESAISYDIRDKAHRDGIVAELVNSGYKLVRGSGGDNSAYRNDTYEVSFETQFDVDGANLMGISGKYYWTLVIYNFKQVEKPGDTNTASSQNLSPAEDEGVVINGVKWASPALLPHRPKASECFTSGTAKWGGVTRANLGQTPMAVRVGILRIQTAKSGQKPTTRRPQAGAYHRKKN